MSNHYWNDQTEKAIQLYNDTTDDALRNKIYEEHIHIPLSKLVEVYVNKSAYKSTNKEQLQQELLGHFASQLNKVDPTKGKAFSYFSRSAQFYCWQNTNVAGRDENRYSSLDAMIGDSEDGKGIQFEDKREENYLTKEKADQLNQWISSLDLELVTSNIFQQHNIYELTTVDKAWVREMGLNGIIETYNNDEAGNARLNRCVSILSKIIQVECLKVKHIGKKSKPALSVKLIIPTSLERACPKCGTVKKYKSEKTYRIAVERNKLCRSCCMEHLPYDSETDFKSKKRMCPGCKKVIEYTNSVKRRYADRLGSVCRTCSENLFRNLAKYLGITTTLRLCNETPPVKINVERQKDWIQYFNGIPFYDTKYIKTYIGLTN